MDDPVIFQLQKSFFQCLWQCGFVPHPQLFPSSPWRGDSSSVESACSATRDLSLFKPHLKASSSTTPSRRSPCSSSRSREALLDIFLDNLLRSDLLPLSDCSLARGAFRSSRRSPPQPPHDGEVVGNRALFLLGGWPLPGQLLVGLEGSGVTSWIVEALRVGFRIPFDRRPPLSERLLSPYWRTRVSPSR